MKEYKALSDINSPVNQFYWHEEIYESKALNDASSHLKKILDTKYEPVDLDKIARDCEYLSVSTDADIIATTQISTSI
jgi:hypothetical protein